MDKKLNFTKKGYLSNDESVPVVVQEQGEKKGHLIFKGPGRGRNSSFTNIASDP